jgi:hypothetical protein
MIPQFEYRLSTAVDHGPASKAFVEAIIKTNRFYRTDKSQILFLVGPNDFVMVTRKSELTAILVEGDVMKITGDPIDDSAEFGFWVWMNNQKWKIPNVATYRAVR